jgi:glycolate oxidase
MTTHHITPEMVRELKQSLGECAVYTDPDKLVSFASDESKLTYLPELVVEPTSTEQIAETMRWASRHRIPITPRAAASNVTGGALAINGGVILSVMKMNRILEIDEKNLIAIVEPGIITYDFQCAVEEKGLYYPPDPSSVDTSTIGGNIAEGAGGPHCLKYGTTKDYVMGLTVVLPNGEILRTGGRTRKGVVGYDLSHLFIGSEGTLGVITEIILRLVPLPKAVTTLLVPFDTLESAASAVAKILAHGIVPAALELSKGNALLPQGHGVSQKTRATLLIELDGSLSAIEEERDEIGDLCLQENALDVLIVEGKAKRKAIWDLRRGNWTKLVDDNAVIETLDPVVPREKMALYVRTVEEIEARYGVPIYCGGHAGDGNVHTNIASRIDTPEIRERMKHAAREIMALALSMGGTIAGEHGIGCVKKEEIIKELSPVSITLQREIKRLIDPLNIMNPGKVLPGDDERSFSPFIVGGVRS